MTAYIMFLRCVSYLIFVGVLMFIAGRFLPKSLFHHHRFPFRVFASEKRGTIYVHLGVRKWLATRCACANRIGTSIACSKASRPLSISTCSVKAVTKHSACWPFATICALILTTAHVTPQKSADSPRKNGRIFRITPTPRQPSCRRSWRTFPLCRQLPYNKPKRWRTIRQRFLLPAKPRYAAIPANVILRCLPFPPAFRILNTVPEHKYSQGVESQCSVTTSKNTASKKAGARKSSLCG